MGQDGLIQEMERAGKKVSNSVRFAGDRQYPYLHLCIVGDEVEVVEEVGAWGHSRGGAAG